MNSIKILFGIAALAVCSIADAQPPSNNSGKGKPTNSGKVNGTYQLKPKFFPYEIVVNSALPAVFDAANNRWKQPLPMPPGQSEVTINYSIINRANTREGWVTATLNNISLLSSASFTNTVGIIPAGTNYTSQFHAYASNAGNYELRITYKTTGHTRVFTPGGDWKYLDTTLAEAVFVYFVPKDFIDNDFDGLDDREETRLLEKYSPYYKFSYDEQEELFRPTNAIWYINHSNLLNFQYGPVAIPNSDLSGHAGLLVDSFSAIGGASSLFSFQKKTEYRLDMDGHYAYGFYNNDGHDWPEIIQSGNIGLYGHATLIPGTKGLVKLEYWQFFAYNRANTGWIEPVAMIFGPEASKVLGHLYDHAGDWATVQVIVQPADKDRNLFKDVIQSVFHYHHGAESRFDIDNRTQSQINANIKTLKTAKMDWSDEHTLQLMIDAHLEYVHPVVYIEWGGHEFWPNPAGSKTGAPNHNGKGKYFYQTHNISNLGELDASFSADAKTIMGFNGYWGSFNVNNGNPPGPTLHTEWQWPAQHNIQGKKIPPTDFEK